MSKNLKTITGQNKELNNSCNVPEKKAIKRASKDEKSIYESVIRQFLLENPEFIKN